MKILVTGAAGYIGSVVAEQLVARGHDVDGLDDLRHGHEAALVPGVRFVRADLLDRSRIEEIFGATSYDAVLHLAAEALIDVSITNPGLFFRVNVAGGLNLLDAMATTGVTRLIFSSTAAVYGEPRQTPIEEDAPLQPVNAYGESKQAFERMLQWYSRAHGLKHISLRYFNACGATERCGECHVPETHLIPIACEAAMGLREDISVFGTDYDTPDGTCLRDYVHVSDIAQAHVLALGAIDHIGSRLYNIGSGTGYSNREVIQTVQHVTGRTIKVAAAPRRLGDPARLVASSQRIRQELGWQPHYGDLEAMVQSAWAWRQRHPGGYAAGTEIA